MFQIKLSYCVNDALDYMNSFRRRHHPALYYLFLTARILLPVAAVASLYVFRVSQAYRQACLSALFVISLFALIPLITDFLTAIVFLKPGANHLVHAELVFDDKAISLSSALGFRSYSYCSAAELLHSAGSGAYYLFLETEQGKEKGRKQSLILPERCFTEGDPAAFGAFLREKTGLDLIEIK